MIQLVEKKLEKLKQVAGNYNKTSVLEQLSKVEAKKFKDVKQLTDWFLTKVLTSKQDQRFKMQIIKFEKELEYWIEANKYFETNDSPHYLKITDMLLDIYDKVDFYSNNASEVIDESKIDNRIGMKLIVSFNPDPQKKALISTLSSKKKEVRALKISEEANNKLETPQPPPVSLPKPQQPKPKPPPIQPKKEPEAPVTVQPTPRPKQQSVMPTPPKITNPVQKQVEKPLPRVVRQQIKPRDQRKPMNAILRDYDFASPQDRKDSEILLVQEMNNYMKNILSRLIQLTKIHDPSHNRLGDEFKFFSRENYQQKFDLPIQVRVSKSFYKIREPDKLTIYSQLRNTEEREEEKLRIEDTKKRKEDEKEVMEYVRGEPKNMYLIAFQEQKIQSDKLNIRTTTVQALMEMDPRYMDSEMLKKCYIS